MSKLHLTNIIPSLEYGKLKKQGIVPKEAYFTKIPRLGGDFPTSITRKVDSWWFGYYMDKFVHLCLSDPDDQLVPEHCRHAFTATVKHAGKQPIISDDCVKELDYFTRVAAFIRDNFPCRSYEKEPTIESKNVQGHPDVVMDDSIYDIKATGRFGRMRLHLVMQLLGYVAIARGEGRVVNTIGAILPAQGIVQAYDVSTWDSTSLLKVLNEQAEKLQQVRECKPSDVAKFLNLLTTIGSHVPRESTLMKTVTRYDHPMQIFLGSRMQAKHKFSDRDITNTRAHLIAEKKQLFVHSPYSINVARNYEDDWVITALTEHFTTLKSISGKGIVVHIGQKAKMDEDEAYMNMYSNVSIAAEYASPECPLLLETDSGGSLIDDPKDLAQFILDMPDEIRSNIGVCLDTCHVFAAGYDNLETLKMFKDKGVRVHLIHYNDSQFEKGLKKDRHAFPGKGLIGMRNMLEIAQFAIEHNIPMVRE